MGIYSPISVWYVEIAINPCPFSTFSSTYQTPPGPGKARLSELEPKVTCLGPIPFVESFLAECKTPFAP